MWYAWGNMTDTRELIEGIETRIEERRETIAELMEPLTMKQRRFVLSYVEHGIGKRAAEEAGYEAKTEGAYWTLNAISVENLQKPSISRAIDELIKMQTGKAFVLSRFSDLATQAKSQDTQLRAVTELAKINGMYANNESPKTVNVVNITLPTPKGIKSNEPIDVSFSST